MSRMDSSRAILCISSHMTSNSAGVDAPAAKIAGADSLNVSSQNLFSSPPNKAICCTLKSSWLDLDKSLVGVRPGFSEDTTVVVIFADEGASRLQK